MVKVFLHLGWLVAFLVAVSIARPAHPRRAYPPSHQYEIILPAGGTAAPPADQQADDGAVRSERSTNLSHITGTARKIQMYIKNRYLQILPDGTVNGTSDDGNDYSILQRQSVKTGQLLVQSVATCLFLCMDSCGLLYGARNFTWDCVFNETFVQQRYITYSSSKYSNEKRTLYMALNKRGVPRKVQVQRKAPLGKLSSYAMVLPIPVSDERVKDLAARILRAREYLEKDTDLPSGDLASIVLAQHPLRHHGYHHLCPQLHVNLQQTPQQEDGTDEAGRDKFRCRKRKKRKKKKRRCKEDEQEGDQCQTLGVKRKKKCQQGEGEQECQKRLEAAKRRRKSRNGDKKLRDSKNQGVKKNKKNQNKGKKNKKKVVSDGEILKDMMSVVNRTVRVGENQSDVDNTESTMTPQSLGSESSFPSPSSSSFTTISTTATSITSVTPSSTTPISSASPTSSAGSHAASVTPSSTTPISSASPTSSAGSHAASVTPSSTTPISSASPTSSTGSHAASVTTSETSSSSSTRIPSLSLSSSLSTKSTSRTSETTGADDVTSVSSSGNWTSLGTTE